MGRKIISCFHTGAKTTLLTACFALLTLGFLWQLGHSMAQTNSQPPHYLPAWLCCTQIIALPACTLGFAAAGIAGMLRKRRPRLASILQIACLTLTLVLGTLLITSIFTSPRQDQQIDITIPPKSTAVVYSTTQVCPQQSTVYIRPGKGLCDAEAVLTPVAGGETMYTYITPGVQMGLRVEKGMWYRVGLTMQNYTGQPVQVSVLLRGVQVRTP